MLSGLVRAWRQLQLKAWARRGKSRLKWVRIRLDVSCGEGVVFVRNPLLLAGAEAPGRPGSLTIRLGNRVRFAPGVMIEAEPGRDSVVEIGDGTRIGANTRFQLRGGSVRIGASSEVRDGCVLRTSGGSIELDDRCFMSYGCVLHATERVVMGERVALAERVTLDDSRQDDPEWSAPSEPVVVGANTLVFPNAMLTTGAHVGANSQVAAGALGAASSPRACCWRACPRG